MEKYFRNFNARKHNARTKYEINKIIKKKDQNQENNKKTQE
jgi:hypothetical protein